MVKGPGMLMLVFDKVFVDDRNIPSGTFFVLFCNEEGHYAAGEYAQVVLPRKSARTVIRHLETTMRQFCLAVLILWFGLLPWAASSAADGRSVDPSPEIHLPKDHTELAQQLVRLSRAKFDLHYKTFGVQEVIGMFDLAHELRVAVAQLRNDIEALRADAENLHRQLAVQEPAEAKHWSDVAQSYRWSAERLSGDEQTELAAAEDLRRQLKKLSDAIEKRCQGADQPIIDREFVRYRFQQAAALVAKHNGNKTAEIECTRKAFMAATQLQRALMLAYEADAIPWNDMFAMSWYPCEAKLALISLTAPEPIEAANDRAAAWEELLHLADKLFERQALFGLDSSSYDQELVRLEQSRIIACLARERGNREDELHALQRIVEAYRHHVRYTEILYVNRCSGYFQLNKAEEQVNTANHELEQARLRHQIEDTAREAGQIESEIVNVRLRRSVAEDTRIVLNRTRAETEQNLYFRRIGYNRGYCDVLAVTEAAVRNHLINVSLGQNDVDLHRIYAEEE